MRKKGRIAAIALSVLMLLSVGWVYADTIADNANVAIEEMLTSVSSDGTLRSLGVKGVGFQRVKALQGKGTISATSTTKADYIKAEVTVQKLNRTTNTYYDYDDPFTVIEYNTTNMTEYPIINVGSSGTYRLEVVFSEKDGSQLTTYSEKYSAAVGL